MIWPRPSVQGAKRKTREYGKVRDKYGYGKGSQDAGVKNICTFKW